MSLRLGCTLLSPYSLSHFRERQREAPAEPGRAFALIFADADCHSFMSLLGLGDIGAEQPVPDAEIKTVVGIGLANQGK